METLKEVLMRRNNLTEQEAEDIIWDAQEMFDDYMRDGDTEAAENICQEYFGLEPDYLHEFIDYS